MRLRQSSLFFTFANESCWSGWDGLDLFITQYCHVGSAKFAFNRNNLCRLLVILQCPSLRRDSSVVSSTGSFYLSGVCSEVLSSFQTVIQFFKVFDLNDALIHVVFAKRFLEILKFSKMNN